jgi:dihydroorotate dehydrogenase electron transfer subunit
VPHGGEGQLPGWACCTVLTREELCADTVYLTIAAPEIAAVASAGQFVQVGVGSAEATDPFLRRPISLAHIDAAAGTIGLIIRAIGRGTRRLLALRPGAKIDLLGPVGHGFPAQLKGRVLLVGGGVGAAPLLPLAAQLAAATPGAGQATGGAGAVFLVGARTHPELWGAVLGARAGVRCVVSTDDGSAGHHGLVTDLVKAQLAAGPVDAICACGPLPMMRAVAMLAAEANVPCYVSLEQRMGCGIGACLGCAWPRSTNAGGGYARVCVDGPVFAATEVVL